MGCGLRRKEALVASGRSTVGDPKPLVHIGDFGIDETCEGAGVGSSFEIVALMPPVFAREVTAIITLVSPVSAGVGQD